MIPVYYNNIIYNINIYTNNVNIFILLYKYINNMKNNIIYNINNINII